MHSSFMTLWFRSRLPVEFRDGETQGPTTREGVTISVALFPNLRTDTDGVSTLEERVVEVHCESPRNPRTTGTGRLMVVSTHRVVSTRPNVRWSVRGAGADLRV